MSFNTNRSDPIHSNGRQLQGAFSINPHKQLLTAFSRRPSVGFAIWRETLIDVAIFREAITNNSARTMPARMAHLFCELFYRARASGLTKGNSFTAPMSCPIGRNPWNVHSQREPHPAGA